MEQLKMNKKKIITFAVLILMILITLNSCVSNETISYDFNSYLNDDSEFTKGISHLMPSREDLLDEKIVSYSYYDDGYVYKGGFFDSLAYNERMILMTIEYNEEDFLGAVQALDEKFESYGLYHEEFELNGNLYKAAMICAEERVYYCAVAYCEDVERQKISYIAFVSKDLEYMNVESALELFNEYDEITNSIIKE